MYVYHYYGSLQVSNGSINEWDGIIELNKPIKNMDDYTRLKKALVDYFKEDIEPSKITIKSLTLI